MNYIFDLFGTLIDCDMDRYRCIMSEYFGLTIREYETRVRPFIDNREFPSEEEALDGLLQHLRIEISEESKRDFLSKLKHWKENLYIKEEDLKLLEQLRESGGIVGVLSNASTFIEEVINKTRVYQYVDLAVFSHKVGISKPDRRIYKYALTLMNCRPNEVTMVGDQLEKDVLVPISLGMRGILFDPKDQHVDYEGSRIKSLRGLII
ncbi:MAG: HAD family hydrolase [Nanoarchaeota archaeon]